MSDPGDKTIEAQIARIDTLSAAARTTWFALLGYLGFVGVTLLGVEDADFFIDSRQTDLPLISVSIPTASFFVFAPVLGAALYIYLHLHLRKLWEALHEPEEAPGGRPLDDQIFPWLVSDLVLGMRGGNAATRRPMDWLASLVTRILVWIAGPLVLLAFWWRSMPAHDEWMTLLIASAALLSLYAGFTSWWHLRCLSTPPEDRASPWSGWVKRTLSLLAVILVLSVSWLRTEGGIEHYVNKSIDVYENVIRGGEPLERFQGQKFENGDDKDPDTAQSEYVRGLPWVWTLEDLTLRQLEDLLQSDDEGFARRFEREEREEKCRNLRQPREGEGSQRGLFVQVEAWLACTWPGLQGRSTLARTDIQGIEIVPGTAGIATRDVARRRFRADWCRRQGLSPEICGHLYSVADPAPEFIKPNRQDWCLKNRWASVQGGKAQAKLTEQSVASCEAHFRDLDNDFREEWQHERAGTMAQLERRDLRGRDLRSADLSRANLTTADLSGARLERASLWQARLEGANLIEARMEGVDLTEARLEGADLFGASMEGAFLWDARMEGANLSRAQLEGAYLWKTWMERVNLYRANMEGAVLWEARLEGANLREARMGGADLNEASMEGADLTEARLEGADLWQARMQGADLTRARMDGAVLWEVRMQGANLSEARLQGAELTDARMNGAFLWAANLQSVNWYDAKIGATPAHFADFRGAEWLSQEQLERVIGNERTIVPPGLNVWTCWLKPPDNLDELADRAQQAIFDFEDQEFRTAAEFKREWLCPEGTEPQPTGTQLGLDETPPWLQ